MMSTPTSPDSRSELTRTPGVALASMMGVAFSAPTVGFTYSIGPFINPLIAEFSWTRQQILTTQTLMTIAIVIASALAGWIADRYGVRRMILISQTMLGGGFFLLAAFLQDLTTLYVLYLLIAFGGGGTVGIGFARLISQRFVRQRGLALGIAMSGSGLCGFLVPPYAAWAVQTFGWRGAYVAIGLLPICISLPLAWRYLHDAPVTANSLPEARTPPESADAKLGVTLLRAMHDYRFWALALGLFLCSGMMTAFVTNIVPLLEESGFDPLAAAGAASAFGVAVLAGRILIGGLMDRFFAPLVGAVFVLPAGLGVALLGALEPDFALVVAIVFLAGLAAGAEVDLMAYLTSRYFGLREYGKIFAAQYIAFALGPGLWVPLIGAMRDDSGSYVTGLYVIGAGVVTFALLLLALGPYTKPAAAHT